MGTSSGKEANDNNNLIMSDNKGGGYNRRAYHSGSWYSSDSIELDETLTKFLQDVDVDDSATTTTNNNNNNNNNNPPQQPQPPLRGLICPHAGYSYSGQTAAYSYWHLQQEIQRQNHNNIKHILVLHPSHHVYLDGCAVSGANNIETPIGNLIVDDELRNEILQLGNFTVMSKIVDEKEHSGEMQYPFIVKALKAGGGKKILDKIKVLPIMCGNLSSSKEEYYGKLLAPIIRRSDVLCIISSDFCHWGNRFNYQPTPPSTANNASSSSTTTKTSTKTSSKAIYEHIQDLDQQGMDLIELQQPGAFVKYLKETQNTICGRHAISVWLNAVHTNSTNKTSTTSDEEILDIQFVKYAQSSQVKSMRDSSVSYASATARKKTKVVS